MIKTYINIRVKPVDIPEFLAFLKEECNGAKIVKEFECGYAGFNIPREQVDRTTWLKRYILEFKSKSEYMRFRKLDRVFMFRASNSKYMKALATRVNGNDYPVGCFK